jgi:hypothetical protein
VRYTDLGTVVKMIEALDEPAVTVIATAAFTGLRKSGLQGLRWEDFKDSRLFVERTAWRPTTILESKKPRAAKAAVPVFSILTTYLETHRKQFPSDGFIFSGPKSGKPLASEPKNDCAPTEQISLAFKLLCTIVSGPNHWKQRNAFRDENCWEEALLARKAGAPRSRHLVSSHSTSTFSSITIYGTRRFACAEARRSLVRFDRVRSRWLAYDSNCR